MRKFDSQAIASSAAASTAPPGSSRSLAACPRRVMVCTRGFSKPAAFRVLSTPLRPIASSAAISICTPPVKSTPRCGPRLWTRSASEAAMRTKEKIVAARRRLMKLNSVAVRKCPFPRGSAWRRLNWSSTSAVISVVTLASKIAEKARLKPTSIALRRLLPARSSSRIRSKISTLASTAIPIVRMMPAIPGSVSVARTIESIPKSMQMFITTAMIARPPAAE